MITGGSVLDEDDMASNSATALSTQQSIKAYSDSATQTLTNKTLTSPLYQGSIDGWVSANETWTYASATTITVPSGATAKYQKGDKIKLTQTTVKYFYVVGVADTVLTITGGSSYTLTTGTITNNYYSHASSPIGFPTAFAWSPTVTYVGGSIDPTSTTVNEAKFTIFQQLVAFTLMATVVRGSGNRTFIVFSVPFGVRSFSGLYFPADTTYSGSQKWTRCYYSGGIIVGAETMASDGTIYLTLFTYIA
jgi:hypothetical protein